jgi:(p)ppGpp synthase/HD superfamily hydrolase
VVAVTAREYAIKHHADQMYGIHPYIVHLDAVADLVRVYGDIAVVIAYLHDIVEDTGVTVADIKYEFGCFVSECVAILTDESGADRNERKSKAYQKMSQVTGEHELALIVKVADRLANVTACINDGDEDRLNMYRSEQEVFERSVYRDGLCDVFSQELDEIISL